MFDYLAHMCLTSSSIPPDLKEYNKDFLKSKYDEIISEGDFDLSYRLSKLLISKCNSYNVKSLIKFSRLDLRDKRVLVHYKVNILQLLMVISRSYEYNSLLIAKSGLLKYVYEFALLSRTGTNDGINYLPLGSNYSTLVESSLNLIQTLSNVNSYGKLTENSVPFGIRLLISKAMKLKKKLKAEGILYMIDPLNLQLNRGSDYDTLGGSSDIMQVLSIETRISQLQTDVMNVEDEMYTLSLFDTGTIDSFKCGELLSKLGLYEHQARLLIEHCLDNEYTPDYNTVSELYEHIKSLSSLCVSRNEENLQSDQESIQNPNNSIDFESNHTNVIVNESCDIVSSTSLPLSHEVTASSSPAVSSSNYLPVNGNTTPGDRGDVNPEEQEFYSEEQTSSVVDVTSSGLPAADLREAKGELNREGCLQDEDKDITSSDLPESDLRELEGEVNREGTTPSEKTSSGEAPCNGKEEDTEELVDLTLSGLPAADLREAEGEVNRGSCLQDEDKVVTSGETSTVEYGPQMDVHVLTSHLESGMEQSVECDDELFMDKSSYSCSLSSKSCDILNDVEVFAMIDEILHADDTEVVKVTGDYTYLTQDEVQSTEDAFVEVTPVHHEHEVDEDNEKSSVKKTHHLVGDLEDSTVVEYTSSDDTEVVKVTGDYTYLTQDEVQPTEDTHLIPHTGGAKSIDNSCIECVSSEQESSRTEVFSTPRSSIENTYPTFYHLSDSSSFEDSSIKGLSFVPPEVTSTVCPTSLPLAVEASSNYLSPRGEATPGDRGGSEVSDGSSIMGMMEDGAKDVLDVTSSGLPAADLREAEGKINRGGCLQDEDKDVTSSGCVNDDIHVESLCEDELITMPTNISIPPSEISTDYNGYPLYKNVPTDDELDNMLDKMINMVQDNLSCIDIKLGLKEDNKNKIDDFNAIEVIVNSMPNLYTKPVIKLMDDKNYYYNSEDGNNAFSSSHGSSNSSQVHELMLNGGNSLYKNNIVDIKFYKELEYGHKCLKINIKIEIINTCHSKLTEFNTDYSDFENFPLNLIVKQTQIFKHKKNSIATRTKTANKQSPIKDQYKPFYTNIQTNHSDYYPPEAQSTSLPLAVEASSNYLPVNGNVTPGDRGEDSDGMKSSTGPRVEPVADLREAEGEVNREAVCRTTSGGAVCKTTKVGVNNITSSATMGSSKDMDDADMVDLGDSCVINFQLCGYAPYKGLPKVILSFNIGDDRQYLSLYLPLPVTSFFIPSLDYGYLNNSDYTTSLNIQNILRNKVYFNINTKFPYNKVIKIATLDGKFKIIDDNKDDTCVYLISTFYTSYTAKFTQNIQDDRNICKFTVFCMIERKDSSINLHVSSESYTLANAVATLYKYLLQ